MEPIISPWIIYLISVTEKLHVIFIFLTIVFSVLSSILGLSLFLGPGYREDEKSILRQKLWFNRITAWLILCILALIVVPSKDTLLEMLISSYITPDNINVVKSSSIDLIKEIMAAINEYK